MAPPLISESFMNFAGFKKCTNFQFTRVQKNFKQLSYTEDGFKCARKKRFQENIYSRPLLSSKMWMSHRTSSPTKPNETLGRITRFFQNNYNEHQIPREQATCTLLLNSSQGIFTVLSCPWRIPSCYIPKRGLLQLKMRCSTPLPFDRP